MLIVVVLGILLAVFSGTVRLPEFARGADGVRHRVFTMDAAGNRTPAFVARNKFFNAQNLAQLAKDTSFTAIMAVGAGIVIISGGIDLSVGAVYALASVVGALVLRHYGPDGPGAGAPGLGILLGAATGLGVGLLCGLLNGSLIVALRVHPFIITLGSMAILRGLAFVITTGQSIGGFPSAFRQLVRYEIGDGLSLVPLAVMVLGDGGRLDLPLPAFAAGRRGPMRSAATSARAARFQRRSGLGGPSVGVYLLAGLTAGIAALLSLGYYMAPPLPATGRATSSMSSPRRSSGAPA